MLHYSGGHIQETKCVGAVRKDSFNFPELRTSEITDGKKRFFCAYGHMCACVCVKSEIWCVIILP